MGKKPSLIVTKRTEIVSLHIVVLSERESTKTHVIKTDVHQAGKEFSITGKYTNLKRSSRPRKASVRAYYPKESLTISISFLRND